MQLSPQVQLDKKETPYVSLHIEKGIMHCIFRSNLHMDLEVAKQCVGARIEFSKGISYPCLIDMEGVKSTDSKARVYMAKEGARLMKAGAMLTSSMYTKMLGNVFLTINKPEIPVRLFSDKATAIKWLKQYL